MSQQARYAILLPWSLAEIGGVNLVVLKLLDCMAAEYHGFVVSSHWQEPIPGEFQWNFPDPSTGRWRDVAAAAVLAGPRALQLRRMTRNCAAVNAHYPGLHLLPAAALRKLRLLAPLLISVHGDDIVLAAAPSRGWKRRAWRWLLESADAVIPCSGSLGEQTLQVAPRARIKVIWNGVEPPTQPPGPRPLAEPYLISVGQFAERKNQQLLLRAFARLAGSFPRLQLVLVGGQGPLLEPLRQQAAQLELANRVHFAVDVEHAKIWDWVAHAECFALTSDREPFGLVLLEAGLCRVPVISTRVGGVPEFLEDGVGGLLVEPGNEDELTAALEKTLGDPAAAKLRAEAFYATARSLTWKRTWEQYRELVHALKSGSPADAG